MGFEFHREVAGGWVRLVVVVGHLTAAIFAFITLTSCNIKTMVSNMMFPEDMGYDGYAASAAGMARTCNSTMQCNREGVPWRYDYVKPNMFWVSYGLLFYAEGLTLAFAMFYMRDDWAFVKWKIVRTSLGPKIKKLRSYVPTTGFLGKCLSNWNMFCHVMAMFFLVSTTVFYCILLWWAWKLTHVLEPTLVLVSSTLAALFFFFFDSFVNTWSKYFEDEGALRGDQTVDDVLAVPKAVPELVSAVPVSTTSARAWNIPTRWLQEPETGGGEHIKLVPVGKEDIIPSSELPGYEAQKVEITIAEAMKTRMQVVARYCEYTLTAPLFYLCILSVVVIDPPYWMFFVGYTCIVACCMYGIVLHLMHIQERLVVELMRKPKMYKTVLVPNVIPNVVPNAVPPAKVVEPGKSVPMVYPNPTVPEFNDTVFHNVVKPQAFQDVVKPQAAGAPDPGPNPAASVPDPALPSSIPSFYGYSSGSGHSYEMPTYSSAPRPVYPAQVVINTTTPGGGSPSVSITRPGPYSTYAPMTNTPATPRRWPVIFAPIERYMGGPAYTPMYKNTLGEPGKIWYVENYDKTIRDGQTASFWHWILAVMMLGQWRNNWVAKLQYLSASWMSLLVALGIVVYAARDLLVSNILPLYVSMAMWTLLLLYASFGIVSFIFYYMLEEFYWDSLDAALDVLSLLSKVPIVLFLVNGYWASPFNLCWGNYHNTIM
jgi:hypothetical protein